MDSLPRAVLLSGIALITLLDIQPASGTTIDPLLFEELVLGADFVGIVECEQAGGIVAEYRVIESWKGPKIGEKISIRVAVNYWEPQFPIALCGERYFVMAYKEAPFRVITTTSGGGVPLWWREIPADYRLPLFQGRRLLDSGEDNGQEFEKTRAAAKALLALAPSAQETALLKAVIEKDLLGKKWIGGESDETRVADLRRQFADLTEPQVVVDKLLELAMSDREKWGIRTEIVLSKGGGKAALEQLERLTADRSPWPKDKLDALIAEVKQRPGTTGAMRPTQPDSAEAEKPPSEAELENLRKTLTMGAEAKDFGEAFEVLMRYDPGPVVDFLVTWENPNEAWHDIDRGYILGSYFAWRCGKEREKHLISLLKAKDPFVRVAGAVYLCFENNRAGTVELQKLTNLKGDPGVWAALTLSRRGQKEAVPRALEVFRELPPDQQERQSGMAGVPHGNLQKRLLVLLSNAARAGGSPQPSLPEEEDRRFDYIADWWKQHGPQTVLLDPLLKTLDKQKVD